MEFGAFVFVLWLFRIQLVAEQQQQQNTTASAVSKGAPAAPSFRSETSAWRGWSYGGERTVGLMRPPRRGGGGAEFSALGRSDQVLPDLQVRWM